MGKVEEEDGDEEARWGEGDGKGWRRGMKMKKQGGRRVMRMERA